MVLQLKKYKEEGVNTEIMHETIGIVILSLFAFHLNIGDRCATFWLQLPRISFALSFIKNRKRAKELYDKDFCIGQWKIGK